MTVKMPLFSGIVETFYGNVENLAADALPERVKRGTFFSDDASGKCSSSSLARSLVARMGKALFP
jgi:hypothetical protein